MDKTTLLDLLISNYTRFEGILAQISPEKMKKLSGDDRQSGKDIGLITFYPKSDGTVPALEWWAWTFTRSEEI